MTLAPLLETWWAPMGGLLALRSWHLGLSTGEKQSTEPGHPSQKDAARMKAAADSLGFTGGSDPHHLRGHLEPVEIGLVRGEVHPYMYAGFEHDAPANARCIRDDAGRYVTLLVDTFENWAPELGRLSKSLPPSKPTWSVDVVSRRDGWLGAFRRCWTCGRWFP